MRKCVVLLAIVLIVSVTVPVLANKGGIPNTERGGKETGKAEQEGPNGPTHGQEKVLICQNMAHNPHEIWVAAPAVDAHLKQGAILGSCPKEEKPTPIPTPTPAPTSEPATVLYRVYCPIVLSSKAEPLVFELPEGAN